MPKRDYHCDSSSDSYSSDDSSFACKKCREKHQKKTKHEKKCCSCEKERHDRCSKPKPHDCKPYICKQGETKPTEEKELDICGDKKNGNYIIITIKS